MFIIMETDNYTSMTDMFYRNGLEVVVGDLPPEGLLRCWEMIDSVTRERVAGVSLEKRDGEYVIGDIAVEKEYRRLNLGTQLLNKAIEEVKSLGGTRILLVAKVPRFFQTAGFNSVKKENLPNISNCMTCKQFNVECFPEIMSLDITKKRV